MFYKYKTGPFTLIETFLHYKIINNYSIHLPEIFDFHTFLITFATENKQKWQQIILK